MKNLLKLLSIVSTLIDFDGMIQGLSSQEPVLKQQVKAQEARVKEVAPDQNTVKKMKSTVEAAKKGEKL